MSNGQPLYNSRLTKMYVEYLRLHHPHVNVESVLKEAGIPSYQIEDPAHWLTQQDVDRFNAAVVAQTGDFNISRQVGRFAASAKGLGAAKQYMLGLLTPAVVYQLMERHYGLLSRAASIATKKLGPTKVAITATPKAGVEEKPYQCENRRGIFEALARWSTGELAHIEHAECFHQGAPHCRYIVTWEKSPSVYWRRISSLLAMAVVLASAVGFSLMPIYAWALMNVALIAVVGLCAFQSERRERMRLEQTVVDQRKAAEETLLESEERYNNAMLAQEIGQATSTILDITNLITAVMCIIEKRLGFDRGMIMLANADRTLLQYSAGFGLDSTQEDLLRTTVFNLETPRSQGLFTRAMSERRPILVESLDQIQGELSPRGLELARKLGGQSLICVPIIHKADALGLLVVDNSASKRPLRQSDVSLLIGVAAQLATSLVNAVSFEKIQESEKQYRELVETASSLILRVSQDGRITFVNEFAQRLLGYSATELLGRKVEGLIHSEGGPDAGRFDRLIADMSRDPMRPTVRESEAALRSGKKAWISWTYRPIFDDSGDFREVLCIGNNITELKRADEEKKELQLCLQRAQKMEAIGTLAGGVAHDLNNILSGIVSYPELLLMDLAEESPLRKPILTIKKSGERAAAIVQDLLTLARRGVETSEVMNLNQVVTDYLASPEFSKLLLNHPALSTTLQLDEQLLNMVGSPVHLSKTVMNLVTNAAEAMPGGGTIVIRTENRHLENEKIGYGEQVSGDYVVLTVSDTGIGIKPEEIEHIFEPFYTRKTMGRSGTGLGMAVVWGTVQDHRGHIDVRSSPGQGTDITLFLPATHRQLRQREEEVPLEAFRSRGETVLIVDDNREQIEIASEMLTRLGYTVTSASSGEEALEELGKRPHDLVVLDMIMNPGIDGLETFKRIQAVRPAQKAIIASGYSESVHVREAQRLGAGAYIKKPYLFHTFARAVRAELDKPFKAGEPFGFQPSEPPAPD
jgi:PAS domain S-box-containing protein